MTELTRRQERAEILRASKGPLGTYQPIRVAGLELDGWTGNSVTVRNGQTTRLPFQRWIDMLALASIDFTGRTALDVGCNIGSVAFEISRAGAAHVVGIDRDPRNVELAREWLELVADDPVWPLRGSVEIVEGDAAAHSAPVDVVCALSIFHQIPAQRTVFEHLASLARRLFVLEIQTPDASISARTLDELADLSSTDRVEGATYGHGHYPSCAAVQRLFRELGFEPRLMGPGRVAGRWVFHAERR